MALARRTDWTDAWRSPAWLPLAQVAEPAYAGWYEPADELVVRFRETRNMRAVVIPIAGQPAEDIALMVDEETGAVAGVQVMPLVASAALRHPAWRECASEHPPAEAVAALVADVRRLFERFGVERGNEP